MRSDELTNSPVTRCLNCISLFYLENWSAVWWGIFPILNPTIPLLTSLPASILVGIDILLNWFAKNKDFEAWRQRDFQTLWSNWRLFLFKIQQFYRHKLPLMLHEKMQFLHHRSTETLAKPCYLLMLLLLSRLMWKYSGCFLPYLIHWV